MITKPIVEIPEFYEPKTTYILYTWSNNLRQKIEGFCIHKIDNFNKPEGEFLASNIQHKLNIAFDKYQYKLGLHYTLDMDWFNVDNVNVYNDRVRINHLYSNAVVKDLERNKDYVCMTTDLSMELTNKLDMIYRYLWEKYGRKWH